MVPIKDTIPSRNISVATWFLIIVNIVVFFYQASLPDEQVLNMIYRYAFIPLRLTKSLNDIEAYIPLFTSMFMHGNLLHLISNMWSLWLFGDNVEDNMGPFRFILFYILTGLIAGFAHFFSNRCPIYQQ